MPREPRKKSESGIYHIMLGGIINTSVVILNGAEESDGCAKYGTLAEISTSLNMMAKGEILH